MNSECDRNKTLVALILFATLIEPSTANWNVHSIKLQNREISNVEIPVADLLSYYPRS